MVNSGKIDYTHQAGIVEIDAKLSTGGKVYAIDENFTGNDILGFDPSVMREENSAYDLFFAEKKTTNSGGVFWADRRSGKNGSLRGGSINTGRRGGKSYGAYIWEEFYTGDDKNYDTASTGVER